MIIYLNITTHNIMWCNKPNIRWNLIYKINVTRQSYQAAGDYRYWLLGAETTLWMVAGPGHTTSRYYIKLSKLTSWVWLDTLVPSGDQLDYPPGLQVGISNVPRICVLRYLAMQVSYFDKRTFTSIDIFAFKSIPLRTHYITEEHDKPYSQYGNIIDSYNS